MQDKLYIPIIIGTAREQRESIKAARLVFEISQEFDSIVTELVDPLEFKFSPDGDGESDKDPRYSDITKRADAFFIVTPEYNHSFPGSLKRMLDTEYENYVHKPVTFAGVSSGNFGGARAIEALVNTVRKMGLIASRKDVYFPNIQTIFDENGKLVDEKYRDAIRQSFEELIWLTNALKTAKNPE